MATDEEIQEAISDRIESGVSDRQIGDRRTSYVDPLKQLEAAEKLAAKRSSPFIRVGFSSRAF
jgi:hypothetical protein